MTKSPTSSPIALEIFFADFSLPAAAGVSAAVPSVLLDAGLLLAAIARPEVPAIDSSNNNVFALLRFIINFFMSVRTPVKYRRLLALICVERRKRLAQSALIGGAIIAW